MSALVWMASLAACQIGMQWDWVDAYSAYTECLQTTQGTEGNLACYARLVEAIGQASVDFMSCLF